MLEAWVKRFQTAGVGQIAVVVGHDAELIRGEVVADLPVHWVVNHEADSTGQRESLLLALDVLPTDTCSWLTPVDVPVVRASTLHRLQERFFSATAQAEGAGQPGPIAAIACHEHRRGHPLLMGTEFQARVAEGERGDRVDELLAWATRRLIELDVRDLRVVGNMNRQEEYQAWAPPPGSSWDWEEPADDLDESEKTLDEE